MPNYAFAYFGEPQFESQEEASKHYAIFQTWMSGLGDVWVNRGTPFGMPKVVSATGVKDGVRTARLTGFAIVKADSLDAAVEMVKDCPYLEHGTIEVSEVIGSM